MNRKFILLLGISLLVVSIDQALKIWILKNFELGESSVVLNGYFNITYVRNFGAAFGFLSESHPTFREIFFLSMPPVALVVILMILRGVKDNDYVQITALSLVFGGAIGNYIDRLRFRYVIDFLDFHIHEKYTWPAFNVADSAIVGGVFILLVLMYFESRQKKQLAQT